MHQNVTLKLDKGLLREAKAHAAHEGKSLSGLMVEALRFLLKKGCGYEKAHRRALTMLNKGWALGGVTAANRAGLHERTGR